MISTLSLRGPSLSSPSSDGGQDRYGREKKITPTQRDQAYKTAWANIRDWIDAQMALVDTEQADIAQVFLPYVVQKNGNTLYENILENPQNLLSEGK